MAEIAASSDAAMAKARMKLVAGVREERDIHIFISIQKNHEIYAKYILLDKAYIDSSEPKN